VTDRIALADCKHGFAYKITSRNLTIGVFNADTRGFVGIREKFGSEYLFTEFHFDTGAPHGTASPFLEIEKCPIEDLRAAFETVCSVCRQHVAFVRNVPEDGYGEWLHNGTRCDNGSPYAPQNDALFGYLKNVHERIR